MRTQASGFVPQNSNSANSNALLAMMQEQMANYSAEEILEMIRKMGAGQAEEKNTFEITQTEDLQGEGEAKFSDEKGELIISKPVFGPKKENAKELVYYSLVRFYGQYSLREFMTAYLQTLYNIDENEAGVLILKIEAYQQSRGLLLENIWKSGFKNLDYESTKEQKYRTIHFYLSEETYAKFAQLLNKEETKKADKQSYPAAYKGIMETDVSALPDKEKKITQQLQYLISQISPDEWAATQKKDESLNNLEDLLIKQLTAYLQGRQAITGNLKQALAKQDAQAAADNLKVANQQILVSLPVDLRLGLIKLFAQKQVDEVEVPLAALITWCPHTQAKEVMASFTQNKAQLFKDLQKLIANKKVLAASFQQLTFNNADLSQLLDFLMQNMGGQQVDGKKTFPWSPGRAVHGIRYWVKISSEGKIKGKYSRFHTTSTFTQGGLVSTTEFTTSKLPEDSGEFELDPLELVIVKMVADDKDLGKKAGDCVVVPAIMLLQMEEEANWNSLMASLKVVFNVALFATGVGQIAAARSAWAIIEGSLLVFIATVEILKDEIAKTEAGKEFLKYYEVFAFMQGAYYGIKLLIEVPQLIAGMARYWSLVKTINSEGKVIEAMAGLDIEMNSLKKQLDAYINTLDEVEKTRVLGKIALEELKIEAIAIKANQKGNLDLGSLSKLFVNGVKKQLIKTDAPLNETKLYFEKLGLAKELAKLSDKELELFLNLAREEVKFLEKVEVMFSKGRLKESKENFLRLKLNEAYPQLTVEEGAIIYDYTKIGSKEINAALRDIVKLPSEEQVLYEDLLNKALNNLDNFDGVALRGSNFFPEHLIKEGTYIDKGFLSSSTDKGVALKFGQKYFIKIFSKTGKKINLISAHRKEMEILFRSGTKFKVKKINSSENQIFIMLTENTI